MFPRSIFVIFGFFVISSFATAGETHYEVELEVPDQAVSDYRRPYVAVWVADTKNKPVQVLALWYQDERWLNDLRHFWRRVMRSESVDVDGVSGATRKPGIYNLHWDGKNSAGEQVARGGYKLCAEAAREHGGHTAKCVDFEVGEGSISQTLRLEGELSMLSLKTHSH